MEEVRSTCPYCGVGCGVLLRPDGAGGLSVTGDPAHPANFGRLCSKGLALGETLGLEDRLLAPRIGGVEADWDSALDLVADRFSRTIAEHGPDSVAFYVSGQLLTEDYYVANKLMKGFIGSANIDTNSRLCMASTVAGHKRAFGTDTVPGTYEDLELADLVVLVGSNLAWCHPVLYQRLAAARAKRGTKVVVIDPRRTASCDIADLHLKLRADTDVALFNGLLAHLATKGAFDQRFIEAHTTGLDDCLAAAAETDVGVTGVPKAEIEQFFRLFAETERTVTVFSQGVNQSTCGTDKVSAILNCHLATGRIGRPGMGPFSVTGQPNAMGGREVGGLANMLAAHLDLENSAHRAAVAEFWGAPAIADRQGLKAVEMFRAAGEGRIKALWIACTNPAVSMPEAQAVRAAIGGCDFVVVSDITGQTDTARLADVLLPALAWGEKEGTVTNSDRTISRQRAALPAPGQARADWAIFADVGRRMGWRSAFDYASPAEIFREHAALSGVAAGLGRDFDISGLSSLSTTGYAAMAPRRWPVTAEAEGGRFFADGAFHTPDGRARLVPVHQPAALAPQGRRYPYTLNTGRVRDQWHTMTRTAKSPRLSRHLAEPFLQIHPADAARVGLHPADIAVVESPHGQALLRVLTTTDVAPGNPFAPMHWTGETAPAGRIGPVVAAATDPVSGQPGSKETYVAVRKWIPAWFAFAVSRRRPNFDCRYWALSRTGTGWRADLAGAEEPEDWVEAAGRMFGLPQAPGMVTDLRGDLTRLSFTDEEGRLIAALFVSKNPVCVARDYVAGCLGSVAPDILAARPGPGRIDPGPVVCACLGVGRNQILAAIESEGPDLARIAAATGASTNCGSCRAELRDLIAQTPPRLAAE